VQIIKPKVLMFGWEFPPYSVGGLGVACHGLTKSMTKLGMKVTFVIPKAPKGAKSHFLDLLVAERVKVSKYEEKNIENIEGITIRKVDSLLMPYMDSQRYSSLIKYLKKNGGTLSDFVQKNVLNDIDLMSQCESNLLEEVWGSVNASKADITKNQYGSNLFEEVWRYANKAAIIAKKETFDIIHVHDWMTFQAGIVAKEVSGKPLVIHIHNTAFDRSGGNPGQREYEIEKEGFERADKIIAISFHVKKRLLENYDVPEDKIIVSYNGIDTEEYCFKPSERNIDNKIVLYAGRVTLQKGPEYFIRAAAKVCETRDDVTFILAGGGDMLAGMVELAAYLKISDRFVFTDWYNKKEGETLMNMADVFVMPSVSEPFGLVPLEAMLQRTPTIISKQSGVSEILENSLKVDFWDTDELANKIISVLDYDSLRNHLVDMGEKEVKAMTWDKTAFKCKRVFERLIYEYKMSENYF